MTPTEKILQEKVDKLEAENALLVQRCEQMSQSYDQLLFQFNELKRYVFGQRSARYIDPDHPQENLFDEVSQPLDPIDDNESTADIVTDIIAYRRRKQNKQDRFPDHLPRREIVISVDESDRQCTQCGSEKVIIQHERHERLNVIPARYEVLVELREKVACPKGCCGQIKVAPKPKHILPKSSLTESTLAHIIVSKLDDRQPFYHLEQQFKQRAGITLSRQTMARSMIQCCDPLQPIINLLKETYLDYDIGALDATTLQVLNEPERSAKTKSYAYCFRGGPPGKNVILYDYNALDHKHFVDRWFDGFKGTLHCDADPFFDTLFSRDDIIESNCHAHARKKFEAITKLAPGSNGLAKEAMVRYKALYAIERYAKDHNFTCDQRYQLRLEHSKPMIESFKVWLDQYYPLTLPKSPLGKAMAYCIRHWEGLCAFLSDGRIEIDNNLTEQEIKPLVMARKNFLFANTVAGAKALCLHFSLIRTAKKHGLDPYHYYVKLLTEIPHCHTLEDYEALLPWAIKLPKVAVKLSA